MTHLNVAIISDDLKDQEILQFPPSKEITLYFFDEKKKFLDHLESNVVDLIIINTLIIEAETKELCNNIRKKSNNCSIPIVLRIDKFNELKDVISSLSFGVDFLITDTINEGWIERFFEEHFEKIVDNQNANSVRYQFNYNQYNLTIEPKRALSLLLSTIDGYIQMKDLVNTYIGIAAHDIRNPLSVILNSTQLFLERFGDTLSEEGNQLLSMVNNSSKHILQILEEMLDISKLDSAKIQLKTTEVDFGELIEECYTINKALAEKEDIQMILEVEENLPKITCDGFKIKQVITNLLTNAVKFSNSNTVIKVIVSTDNEKLYMSVEDRGLGISADDFSKVFHEFGRTKTTSVHGEKNTGLGLAIAKKIMDLHGGDISFSSKKDEGSIFNITLPLKPISNGNIPPK